MRSVVRAATPTPASTSTHDKPLAARAENLLSSASKVQRSNLDEWLASDDRRRMEMSRELAAKVRAIDAQRQQQQHEEETKEEESLPPEPDSDDESDEDSNPLSHIDPILASKLSIDDLDGASINTADILSGIEDSSSDSSVSDSSDGEGEDEKETKEEWPGSPMSGYSSPASSQASSAIHKPISLSKEDMPYDIVDYVIGDLHEELVLEKKGKPSRNRSLVL